MTSGPPREPETFREFLNLVCCRPAMWVGRNDFELAAVFLDGIDAGLSRLPSEKNRGLRGFREWLAVRLNSCVRASWYQILLHEDVGPDPFEALVRLYEEFWRDREKRGLSAILDDFDRLQRSIISSPRDRTCWCEVWSLNRNS